MGRKSLKTVRQKEIVKAFYSVSKKEGLEKTSIAKVADHLQVNPSLIIHYFKSKDELLLALIDYILERYRGIYKDKNHIISRERLIEQIDMLFSRKWNSLFDDGVFYSCYALTYKNEKIKNRFREIHYELRSIFVNTLENARKNNVIEDINIKEASDLIFTMVDGVYYYCGIIDNKKETERLLELCKNKVIALLNIV